MWSCSTFYFKSKQAINLRSFSYGRQGTTTTTTTIGFKQMPIPIVAIGDVMGKICWVCFNAKGDTIKCVVL
jgi:hypothetical protein